MSRKKPSPTALSLLPSGIINTNDQSCLQTIKSRQTEELVIALCGAMGSGTSSVGDIIEDILNKFNYEVTFIKLSDFIRKCSESIINNTQFINNSLADQYRTLQLEGNNLRKKYSKDILAQLAIYEITKERIQYERYKNNGDVDTDAHHIRRHATIIDSLKHPEEWRLLKTVYGNMFYLFGILCPAPVRSSRLRTEKQISETEAVDLILRDKSESIKHGQQFIHTVYHSDFFIRNIDNNKEKLQTSLDRYIKLILGDNKFPPTLHEYAMYIAQSSAHRSSCLSRQVGAALVSTSGDIIASGRNDAPKVGGGLYGDGGCTDYSCAHTNGCTNYKYKKILSNQIRDIIRDSFPDAPEELLETVISNIKDNTMLKDLIEYSKAVHAEMDAILSAARKGSRNLVGSTLYCTTFPCHHCARHIIASGINTVYYIEPYEKSLACDLHPDEILIDSETSSQQDNKVRILPFEGVAPKQFMNLFRDRDKKKDGQRMRVDLTKEKPMSEQLMDPFTTYEVKVVEILTKSEIFTQFFPESTYNEK